MSRLAVIANDSIGYNNRVSMIKPPRSNYQSKLAELDGLVFADEAAFAQSGLWHEMLSPGQHRPRLLVDVGCADGALVRAMAARHRSDLFVGLDWKVKAIYDAGRGARDAELKNVPFIRGRASDLPRMFAVAEIDELLIFHPEPCEEDRQRPNRLISQAFLKLIAPLLRDGSFVCIKTDHAEYAQAICDSLAAAEMKALYATDAVSRDFWNDPKVLKHTADRPFAEEVTLYEQRFIRRKKPIHYIELRRI